MKKNLIIAVLNSILACFLLVFNVYGWYTNNTSVSAGGIFGSSSSGNYTLKLQRGTYNKETDVWTWVDANSLSFSNISPGNKFFFRIVIDSNEAYTYEFEASFSGINSSLVENKLVVSENGEYIQTIEAEDQRLNLYKIEEGNVVTVRCEDDIKTLYTISDNVISLADFKIEDTFNFYSIGETEPDDNMLTGLTGVELKNLIFDFSANAEGDNIYYYFALEFDESKSLEIIDGIESSNCYMYQKLSIAHIQITCLN